MEKLKININRANKSELKKIPGIGDAAADKILSFRKTGGVLKTVNDVKKVAGVRSNFGKAIESKVVFNDKKETKKNIPIKPKNPIKEGGLKTVGNPVKGNGPIIDIIKPFNPTLPLGPMRFPKFESYKFKVKLEGINDKTLPSLKGYKLVVGYKVGNYSKLGAPGFVEKSKTFTIGSSNIINVAIPKPLIAISRLIDNFNLVILDDEGKSIYDSTFQIDEGSEVEIGLPVFNSQNLIIALDKDKKVNYEGYRLKVVSKTNRGVSGIQLQTKSFDINNQTKFSVGFDSFGEVKEIELIAYAASGVIFYKENHPWSAISKVGGIKKLTVNLPKPNELAYTIQLVVDPDELNNPYLDHRLVLNYDLKDADTLDFVKRIEKVYTINALGQSKIDLDYYGIIDKMELQVKAPSGEVIGKRSITISDIDANNEVEVKVPPKQLAGVDGIETLPERPKKVSGRVIDAKGDKKFEEVQVIIYAATKEDPEEEDFRPVVIATTEAEGYFLIDTPVGYFTEAYAKIGIPQKGNIESQSIDVPIRLETDKVVTVDDGEVEIIDKLFFPSKVILVVDTDGEDEEDCDCNDCGTLDFHSPKRVVDEFSFYTVVRTTEPDIKGYTLEDDGEMTIQNVIDIIPNLEAQSGKNSQISSDFRQQRISKNILLKYLNDKKGVTFTTLNKALNESNARKLRERILPQKQIKAVGRHILDVNNSIDWDEEPTIYQAITLSHGHLLHFKQEWVNDGYGMGDLLYSLPLAPGQKKQIVVYDWERRESASRTEALDYQESLQNSLSRDRDINEIVRGSLNENVRGGSSAKTSSFGAGFGIGAIGTGVGALLGVAGGSSKASSSAWQNSSRTTALNDLQQLRDKTIQSANSVRSQRGTVIQTATQGERFSVESEVVANYNHCHSLTMQYFEVLRFLKIQQRLSSVQECLFIPLIMSPFDSQKTLRWREILNRFVYSRRLRRGFDAIERIDNGYEGSDLPTGTFAEENLNFIEGGLNIKFDIPSPTDFSIAETRDAVKDALSRVFWLIGNIDAHIDRIFAAKAEKRNEVFYSYVAPEIAAAFIENLKIEAVVESGNDGSETTVELPIDTSLITRFQNGKSHYVSLRQDDQLDGISRESIRAINITKGSNVTLSGGQTISEALPPNTKITITSGNMRYRTSHFSGTLFRKSRILDDLVGYGYNDDSERVRIATPLNRAEMRNPRNEDLELANALQDHLNDNLEQYHKVIWMTMSDERRFMFLDGIQVTDYSDIVNYPGGIIRSVASVVENRVIGIVGNNLVMPVAPGFKLDPNTRGKDVDLISLYQPLTPIEPINVSIPTKGVFAEAVMGKCNSCEIKEEDRFWKWEEHPIPDSPTAIGTINTDSRRSTPLDTTPTSFPSPIVNIQNAPDAPNPTGIAALQDLLGKQSFKDITGLDQNQKNALEALKASLSTAQAFGSKAGDMAALGAQLEAIKKAKENKMLDQDKAKDLTEEAIKSYGTGKSSSKVLQGIDQLKKVKEMVAKGELPKETGDLLTKSILDNISKGDSSVLENPAIKERIEEGDSLEFSSDKESISLGNEKTEDKAVDNTLLKFAVNFRRPRTFARANSSGHVNVGYAGHFGFDWLRDEYIHPMVKVDKDLDGKTNINAKRALCTDAAALKTEYSKGVKFPITPHGKEYHPAWVSIFPPRGIPNFGKGSRMHEKGVKFSLEIDEIDVLDNRENTIEFKSTNGFLSVTPSSIKLKDLIKKGKKKTKVLDAAKGLSRTYWEVEDAVTLTSSKGLLTSHAEIRVFAKGSDKQEEVGKLMVYQNDRIPKAELVMVRVSYDDVNVKLDSSYHDILKNQSFNQALIRAEVKADEKFIINKLDATDADVIKFKTDFPKGTKHASGSAFLTAITSLYKKLGKNNPPAGSKRSIIFLTDETSQAGGTAQGHGYAAGKYVWGNAVVVFGSNLAAKDSFIHEIGHSLSLAHTFDNDAKDAGILHKFYKGFTDNYMDYTSRFDGTSNSNSRLYFCKWQWDIMRGDQSLIDTY